MSRREEIANKLRTAANAVNLIGVLGVIGWVIVAVWGLSQQGETFDYRTLRTIERDNTSLVIIAFAAALVTAIQTMWASAVANGIAEVLHADAEPAKPGV